MTFLKRLAALLSIPILLTAGGTVPDGMGAWDNGSRDPIPASSTRFFYKHIGAWTGPEFDYASLAMASLDAELPNVRIWYGQPGGNVVQVWMSRDGNPPTVGCLDTDPSTICKLQETFCEQWGENAGPSYRLCEAYRIRIYANNVYAYAARTGRNPSIVWHIAIRHEMGHVLGLPHNGGIMGNDFDTVAPLSTCQQEMLSQYVVNPEILDWVYLPAPLACQE